MIKAVIFDRDGVLIDSEAVHVQSFEAAFKEFNISLDTQDKEWIAGRRPEEHLPILNDKYNISYEDIRKIQRPKFDELFKSVRVFSDTIDLLKDAHARGLLIALATSSNKTSTDLLLSKLGIEKLFSVITTHEDCAKCKPDPEPYILTAKKLGIKPEECLVVEDSGPGLKSAKSAGMKCIVIYNEYTKNHDFLKADKVVKSAKELDLSKLLK